MTKDQFKKSIVMVWPKWAITPEGETNVVVECTPRIAEVLLERGGVYIDYYRFRVDAQVEWMRRRLFSRVLSATALTTLRKTAATRSVAAVTAENWATWLATARTLRNAEIVQLEVILPTTE